MVPGFNAKRILLLIWICCSIFTWTTAGLSNVELPVSYIGGIFGFSKLQMFEEFEKLWNFSKKIKKYYFI